MTKHIEELIVKFNEHTVGSMHLGEKGIVHFSYDTQWLIDGFNLSPFDLKWDSSLQTPRDISLFSGLHGVFADSISDGWGLMLTDRALQKKFGWDKHTITQLDRLYFMGARSMGGLEFYPCDKLVSAQDTFDIQHIFSETQKLLNGETEEVIKELYLSGGSPGGARPKAVFARKGEHLIAGYGTIPAGYEAWIVKFFSSIDSQAMGRIEKAYADMAHDCGLIMPATDLLEVTVDKKKQAFFAIERFDRRDNQRIHVASLSGLVYASHRLPSVSYKDILKVTQHLTKNIQEVEKVIAVMLFNIILHNQDDHTKNFAYLFNENNHAWELTPGYDLVYSVGLGAEHMSDVSGSGKPTYQDVKKLVSQFNLNAEQQIEKTVDVANNWKYYAQRYDVPTKDMREIDKVLQEKIKQFNYQKLSLNPKKR